MGARKIIHRAPKLGRHWETHHVQRQKPELRPMFIQNVYRMNTSVRFFASGASKMICFSNASDAMSDAYTDRIGRVPYLPVCF
jgi:hypothetical protein